MASDAQRDATEVRFSTEMNAAGVRELRASFLDTEYAMEHDLTLLAQVIFDAMERARALRSEKTELMGGGSASLNGWPGNQGTAPAEGVQECRWNSGAADSGERPASLSAEGTMPAIDEESYPYRMSEGEIRDARGRRVTVPGNLGVVQLLNTIVELRHELRSNRSATLAIMECASCGNRQPAKDGIPCARCGDGYKWSGPCT